LAETMTVGEAAIDEIALAPNKDNAGILDVKIKGALGDSCTKLGAIDQRDEKGAVKIRVRTERPADMICAQVIKTFEQTVFINLLTKEAGDYVVSVNEVQKTMSVDKDGKATVK
jgi:hypothetical protein